MLLPKLLGGLLFFAPIALAVTIAGHGTGLLHGPAASHNLGVTHITFADCDTLPDEFDLRDLGNVPKVRDQGSCGSCWAFSKTASLESAWALTHQQMLDLSEQELVSCDHNNWGCNGGLLGDGKREYQVVHGQALEESFPYRAMDVTCKPKLTPAANGVDFALIGVSNHPPSEKEIMCALFKTKTIPWITVSAGGRWGNPPTSDNGLWAGCSRGQTNHAVGLVGWKKVGGRVYFKMRNSWGNGWGSTAGRPGAEKGYALLPYLCDSLGDEMGVIVTENTPCHPPQPRLPTEVTLYAGAESVLGVKAEPGVTYEWYADGVKIGEGNVIYVSPMHETVYTIKAKNNCGNSESSTRVKVLESPL